MENEYIKNRKIAGLFLGLTMFGFIFFFLMKNSYIYVSPYVKWNARITYKNGTKEGISLYSVHGIYGYRTKDGKIIQKPFATQIHNYSKEGVAIYQDHRNGLYGLVNNDGTIKRKALMSTVNEIEYDNPIGFVYQDKNNKKYGLLDEKGESLLKPMFTKILVVDETRLLFKRKNEDDLYGLMNNHGSVISEAFATEVMKINRGSRDYFAYRLKEKGEWGIADENGKNIKAPFAKSIMSEGGFTKDANLIYCDLPNSMENQLFVLNMETKEVKEANYNLLKYTYTHYFDDIYQYSRITESSEPGPIGLIRGEEIIKEPFAVEFGWKNEDHQTVQLFEKNKISKYIDYETRLSGLIDVNGKIIFEAQAEKIKEFKNNSAAYQVAGKWGLLNEDGEIKIKPFAWAFGDLSHGSDKYYFIEEAEGMFGVIDSEGRIIQPPFAEDIYSWIGEGKSEIILFVDKDKKRGILSKEGEILREPFTSNIVRANKGAKYFIYQDNETKKLGLIDNQGTIIKEPFAYEIYRNNKEYGTFLEVVKGDDVPRKLTGFQIEENGLWGILNNEGEIIKEPFASELIYFEKETIVGYKENGSNKIGLVNVNGKILVEPNYATVEEAYESLKK